MKTIALAIGLFGAGCYHFVPWGGELRAPGAVVHVERFDVTVTDTMSDRPRLRRDDVWLRLVGDCDGAHVDERLGGLARGPSLRSE